ncbi:ferrous iron transport protein A [Candidatus Thorarchaeota archaeon]|nr:MAG: ferrous iron transport protein A [Candidatus Thorarchaeota archaeon]
MGTAGSSQSDTPGVRRLTEAKPGREYSMVGLAKSSVDIHTRPRRGHGHGRGGRHRKFKKGPFRQHFMKNPHSEIREIMGRLVDLGLTRGCKFKVVQGGSKGPVLVEVRGTRVALGHALAERVLVKEATC